MRSGRWVGGLFAELSYASSEVVKAKDLVLEEECEVGPDGSILYGADGVPLLKGCSIALRWEDIETLAVYPT
jgi:hypothetical protein